MVTHPSILLIEDSPGECELFRLALARTSLDVVLYAEYDAEAAFHLLEGRVYQHPLPALILLDLKLGRRNGCDFLKRLRADARFAAIPVVVFTTSDDQTDLARCYASGANGYVVKPGTFDELVHCTGDICRYWLKWNLAPGSFMDTSTAIADTLLRPAGSPLSRSTDPSSSTPPSLATPRAGLATPLRNFVTKPHDDPGDPSMADTRC
jgi:CheY-like chemotaxis protein